MEIKTKIAYRIARFGVGLAILGGVLYGTLATAYVISPTFQPFISTGDGWRIGLTDYWKGIPIKMGSRAPIPDSSFNLQVHYPDGSTGSKRSITTYRDFLTYDRENLTKDPVIKGDTITASFLVGSEVDPNIKAATISEITYYVWPPTPGKRFLLYLPTFLQYLLWILCGILLRIVLLNIIKGQVFKSNSYRRLEWMGTAMVMVQLLFVVMDVTHAFGPPNVRVRFASTEAGAHVPFDISSFTNSAFSLAWLVTGCIILVLAKGFREGDELRAQKEVLQKKNEEMNEELNLTY